MPRIEVVESVSELTSLTPQWNELEMPSPMQSPEWLLAWWDAFRTPQDSLHVVAIRSDENQLIGLVPWYRREGFASGATLRFLGDGRACSDFQTLLCRTGYAQEVLSTLIHWLTNDRSLRWDLIDLEGISAADQCVAEFQEAMSLRGHVTHVRQTLNTWRLSLEGGLDGVYANFSKTQSRQLRNFLNRFDKGDFALRHASEELENKEFFISEVMRLHQLHWEANGQPGCFGTSEFRQFFRTAMHAMLDKGMAEILLLERAGRYVAANAWLVRNNIGFGYQCGRDPADDEHRVGRLLQSAALRENCRQGLVAFDFLRGDEQYKQQMRAQPTACQRLRVVARARMSELRHTIWATCREVKSLLNGKP